jgi:hypothetical protein
LTVMLKFGSGGGLGSKLKFGGLTLTLTKQNLEYINTQY